MFQNREHLSSRGLFQFPWKSSFLELLRKANSKQRQKKKEVYYPRIMYYKWRHSQSRHYQTLKALHRPPSRSIPFCLQVPCLFPSSPTNFSVNPSGRLLCTLRFRVIDKNRRPLLLVDRQPFRETRGQIFDVPPVQFRANNIQSRNKGNYTKRRDPCFVYEFVHFRNIGRVRFTNVRTMSNVDGIWLFF